MRKIIKVPKSKESEKRITLPLLWDGIKQQEIQNQKWMLKDIYGTVSNQFAFLRFTTMSPSLHLIVNFFFFSNGMRKLILQPKETKTGSHV